MLLFAQAECTQTEDVNLSKNLWGGAAASIGLLMCLWFTFTMQYLYRTDVIDEKLGNLKIVTIDDYAVQTRLPKGLYAEWLKNKSGSFTDDTVPINEFTKDIGASIKRQIIHEEGSTITEETGRIIDIHFGFNNTKLHKLLEARAAALKSANIQKLR